MSLDGTKEILKQSYNDRITTLVNHKMNVCYHIISKGHNQDYVCSDQAEGGRVNYSLQVWCIVP